MKFICGVILFAHLLNFMALKLISICTQLQLLHQPRGVDFFRTSIQWRLISPVELISFGVTQRNSYVSVINKYHRGLGYKFQYNILNQDTNSIQTPFDSQLKNSSTSWKRPLNSTQLQQIEKLRNLLLGLDINAGKSSLIPNRDNNRQLRFMPNQFNREQAQQVDKLQNLLVDTDVKPGKSSPAALLVRQRPFALKAAEPKFLQCLANCPTTNQYNPVCGSNHQTYHNEQKLFCAIRCGATVQMHTVGVCSLDF